MIVLVKLMYFWLESILLAIDWAELITKIFSAFSVKYYFWIDYIKFIYFAADGTRCEMGWHGYYNICYYFSLDKTDFYSAAQACHSKDSILAIDSGQESHFMLDRTSRIGAYENETSYWFGLYDHYGVRFDLCTIHEYYIIHIIICT